MTDERIEETGVGGACPERGHPARCGTAILALTAHGGDAYATAGRMPALHPLNLAAGTGRVSSRY
jgi:hypothetical protein